MLRKARVSTEELRAVWSRFERHEVAIYQLVLKCFNILTIDLDIQLLFSTECDFVPQRIFGNVWRHFS